MDSLTRMTASQILISDRFNGPVGSGNGGYSAGLLAGFVGEPCVISLRLPPPLNDVLQVERRADRWVALDAQGRVVLEGYPVTAVPASLSTAPAPTTPFPTLAQARSARQRFAFADNHPFPTCFCCGTERSDGLSIHCGPLENGRTWACDWTVPGEWADPDGLVPAPLIWSALDCPTAAPWADPDDDQPMVLAQFAVWREHEVRAGEELVVAAWRGTADGRKHTSTSALIDSDGTVRAHARALWIRLRADADG